MTPDKTPRRWWINDDHGNRVVPPDEIKSRYVEVIEAGTYDAIEAELQRERRKVEKLREQRDRHIDTIYTNKEEVKFDNDAELEAIDNEAAKE